MKSNVQSHLVQSKYVEGYDSSSEYKKKNGRIKMTLLKGEREQGFSEQNDFIRQNTFIKRSYKEQKFQPIHPYTEDEMVIKYSALSSNSKRKKKLEVITISDRLGSSIYQSKRQQKQ